MPPLESAPEIILVETQAELDAQFGDFLRGKNSYLAAYDSEKPLHSFIPRDMDCQLGVVNLMFAGVVKAGDVLGADYFPDYATYERMTDGVVPPELESKVKIIRDEQGNSL